MKPVLVSEPPAWHGREPKRKLSDPDSVKVT